MDIWFLEAGIKRGFALIKQRQENLSTDCHVVCLSHALITLSIIDKSFASLSVMERLFLFFLDYLNDSDDDLGQLTFEYTLRKIDEELSFANEYLQSKIDEGANSKTIKTTKKSIAKIEERKQEMIVHYEELCEWSALPQWPWSGPFATEPDDVDDNGDEVERYWIHADGLQKTYTDPSVLPGSGVDVCDNISCYFLNEEYRTKGAAMRLPIEKFCDMNNVLFKGIIWLLMKELSEGSLRQYIMPSTSSEEPI